MSVVDASGLSDVGKKRKGNEDWFALDDALGLYVVADGMGGHKAGEVASKIVVETILDRMRQPVSSKDGLDLIIHPGPLSAEAARLMAGIHMANHAVYDLAQQRSDYEGMGSTVSAVMLCGDRLMVANVGDSPVYLVRDGVVKEVSVPHTYMAEHAALAPAGTAPLDSRYRHMITRAVGVKPKVQPDISEFKAQVFDAVIICSDGLSDKVAPKEIGAIALKFKPDKAAHTLVSLANKRGGEDNITVIILHLAEVTPSANAPSAASAARPAAAATADLAVDVDTEDASHHTQIQMTAPTGGFIATTDAYSIGQELTLTFMDPDGSAFFTVDGRVVDRTPTGIALVFTHLEEEDTDKLTALIAKGTA